MKILKNSVFLVIVFSVIACNKEKLAIDWDLEFSKLGAMGHAYKTIGNEDCIGKCQWTNPEVGVLAFDGKIEQGSYLEFMSKINDSVHEIRLNSGGGVVSAALNIAEQIQARNLKVVVNGFCISSCANYLFLAGSEKTINGVVGFHGNAQAALEQSNYCEKKEKLPACEVAKKEKVFLKKTGINEELFRITQSEDKGMGDQRTYAYYAPSKNTLTALGVKGVIGDQSKEYLEQLSNLQKKFEDNDFSIAQDPNPAVIKLIQDMEMKNSHLQK